MVEHPGLSNRLDLRDHFFSAECSWERDRAGTVVGADAVEWREAAGRGDPDDCVEPSTEPKFVDRVDGEDCCDKVGSVDFVHDAGLPNCGILSWGLKTYVCTESADLVTGADRVAPEDDVERTSRVETLAGVKREENSESR